VIPLSYEANYLNLLVFLGISLFNNSYKALSSSASHLLGSGSSLVYSYLYSHSQPSKSKIVISTPSSTIVVGPSPFPQSNALKVQSQYSSHDSPFQAKTLADPALAMAAAA
jgi:hypothetical protein